MPHLRRQPPPFATALKATILGLSVFTVGVGGVLAQQQSRTGAAQPPAAQAPPATLTLFGQPGFGGATRTITQNTPNLGVRTVDAGDFAASARAVGVWEVCRDANYRTGCRRISGDVPDLGADRWTLSSARLVAAPAAPPRTAALPQSPPPPAAAPAAQARLTLFNHAGFRGSQRVIETNVTNLGSREHDAGDFAGSLIALGRWQVCTDANYRGRCFEVRGEVADLGRDSQSLSSVRLLEPPTSEEAAAAAAPASGPGGSAQGPGGTGQAAARDQAPRDPTLADRLAKEAADQAEQKAKEEVGQRARRAVGRLFGN
jgi:hypothetical protein